LSQTVSEAPKDVFQPALKRSFGRSDSTASGDSPKERIGESVSLLILFSLCLYLCLINEYCEFKLFFLICVLVPPSQKPVTTSLRIDKFVRPFTLKAVQELLGKTGSVQSFWMDHIKTHCYVTVCSLCSSNTCVPIFVVPFCHIAVQRKNESVCAYLSIHPT
jgi:apoptotic chromatin condensation inducer in the nucleus